MNEKIDILKGLAILGVIAIHVDSNLFNFVADETIIKNGIFTFDQIVRFSVPFFVFLSGLALGSKYLDKKIDVIEFLKRRVFKLLPLYFLWTGIIYLITHMVPSWSGFSDSFPLWQVIFWGKAEYHLYFVPMVFQLYLLFPLFLFFIRKKPHLFLAITFIFQLILLWQFPRQIAWTDQEQYIFFGSWVFYFVLGIFLSQKNVLANIGPSAKKLIAVGIIGTLIWTVLDTFNLMNLRENIIVATRSSKISVYFYSIFFSVGSFISQTSIYKIVGPLKKILVFIGQKSYLIYLSHTLVIRIFFEPFYNKNADLLLLLNCEVILAIGLYLSMLRWNHGKVVPIETRI